MFGWEFPPHITGGLGTACHGIVKGLSGIKDVAVTLVLPKLRGGEDSSFATLLELPGADADGSSGQAAAQINPYGRDLIDVAQVYAERVASLHLDYDCYDVIHAHDWLTAMAGASARRISGKPLVLHIHSTEYDRAGAHADPRIVAIERRGMQAADKIIAVSNFTRNIIIERYGQERDKVVTIYNGIEMPAGTPLARPKTASRTVTFLGRVTHQKGPAYFVEAASKALAAAPDLHFVMAGDGDQLPAMKALAASLGLGTRIAFPGFLPAPEVRRLLERTDIYVMPSVSEPFGISALEAIDAGVPSILSRQSGVVELFEHVHLVDYWDVDAIAGGIVRLASDPAYAEAMRSNARRELAGVNWHACAEKLATHYRRLMASTYLRQLSDAA
jgi:glycosyltransferase involved in cell wall biosynthesis